jgi:hypothetical protein
LASSPVVDAIDRELSAIGGHNHLVAQVEGRLDAEEGQVEPAADERLGEVRRIYGWVNIGWKSGVNP